MEYLMVAIAAGIAIGTVVRLKQHRFPTTPVTEHELPTVSLLIPARNETHAVTRALTNALGLDYPKLEIIVLDDESQDDTPEKIRSFAQDGVRFIKGGSLPDGWIGKNWACHQLSESASGDYFIFCDMDVHLSSKGLAKLIRYAYTEKITGCSIYPRLELFRKIDTFFTPLYAWFLLMLPQAASLQPAYGGLLLFHAKEYRRHGGFQRYPGHMLPELHIARDITRRRYRFFMHTRALDITLHKKASSLNDTRKRQLARLYQESFIAGVAHLLLTVFPIVVLLTNMWAYLLVLIGYAVLMRVQINHWILATLFLPIICIWEFGMLIYSVAMRMGGHMTWKNRRT